MKNHEIEFYETERGENFVADFLDGLKEKTRNKTLAWISMLGKYGSDLKRPYADLLESPIRELRVSFANDEVRILYFFAGNTIVLTHGFIKKTREVPQSEIEKAKRIMSDWQRRSL
ncbi:MAG: type II toxin-antitoxin system RelE/ParE family toxin [Elusimicrobiales bacterium]|nr:type II toxin-antitoxin system RelE/ParE family toxin [Elusimicrobiales bacterium]